MKYKPFAPIEKDSVSAKAEVEERATSAADIKLFF